MRHRELRGDGAARFGSAEIPPAILVKLIAGRCGCPAFWRHSNAARTSGISKRRNPLDVANMFYSQIDKFG